MDVLNNESSSSPFLLLNDSNTFLYVESLTESTNYSETSNPSNCTDNYIYYHTTDKWLLGVVILPFIFVGLLANGLSVLIFSHRYMRRQTINWYLLILGISDAVVLLGAFFVLTLPRLGEIFTWWKAVAFSYYSTPVIYTFMTMAQTTSIWMTVAMSLHRFIGVCFPYKSNSILTTNNVKRLIYVILVLSIIFNGTRFFEVNFKVCKMLNIDVELPSLGASEFRKNELYRKIFYQWAYSLIMFAIPFSILIIVTACVIVAIHKSRKIHASLNVHDDDARKQELAKEITTSIMLVSIVISFILCNTLAIVVNLMENLEINKLYELLVPWCNTLVTLNASINICIYCIFSDRYRLLLFHYLQLKWIKRPENNFSSTLNTH